MRILVAGGTVATATGSFRADVLAEGGVILQVGENLARDGAQVLDASGLLVIPGGVDVHTHFGLDVGFAQVADDFYHGTKAAAMGGVTCIVEHPGFGPAGCGLLHQVEAFKKLADGRCCVDYGLHGVAQGDGHFDGLEELARAGCPSIKAYTTYGGRLGEEPLLSLMDGAASSPLPVLVAVHCEDHALVSWLAARYRASAPHDPMSHARSRPDYAEALAVRQAVALARAAGATLYVVHLSSAAGLSVVQEAQAEGVKVIAETCPQYLLLDETRYQEPDGLAYIMAPPLRREADREALWRGLQGGSISVAATDHCAFSLADKRRLGTSSVFDCPGGIPGVQTRLPLLYTYGVLAGRISLERFVEVCCTAPAYVMGLTRKGRLEPGFDADMTVLDPQAERVISAATLNQRVDYTPFEGMAVRGWPRHVLSRGRAVVQDGEFAGEPGWGRFVHRIVETS
ncbi:dihydropyrimidinase [Fundidesulfovibrio putealis]|uniref:dihydropyrimidinase n=1 Tax=Fundidesulfovibrio putealis TaxID=270496 RepID=UPI0004069AFE|nr:dihydropyrimidinase [Fundidesulfovibrio putealis]